TAVNMHRRASDAAEIAFWRQNAHGYDANIKSDPESYAETLRTIRAYVWRGDTLLDVGAGSGRFAIPLAESVRQVTALDLSPDMLAILERRAAEKDISNIQLLRGSWEDTPVEPHDVVLAAWSLYRQRDILTSLQKLIATTRRTLIIVDGDYASRPDDDPPHDRLKTQVWGKGDPGLCNYLYFAGMLLQCRVRAEVRLVHERMTRTAPDVPALARDFAPHDATASDLAAFTNRLTPHVQPTPDGVMYSCRFAVGLVIWQRTGGEN
ncbi:MAG: class I SAM-dependent methyltransferase, partial [Chloroflexota bacterium]